MSMLGKSYLVAGFLYPYVVRQWDGKVWNDITYPKSWQEAKEKWNDLTENGTKHVDGDMYYDVFEARTFMEKRNPLPDLEKEVERLKSEIETLQERNRELEEQNNQWRRAWDEDDRDTRYFSKAMRWQKRMLDAESSVGNLTKRLNNAIGVLTHIRDITYYKSVLPGMNISSFAHHINILVRDFLNSSIDSEDTYSNDLEKLQADLRHIENVLEYSKAQASELYDENEDLTHEVESLKAALETANNGWNEASADRHRLLKEVRQLDEELYQLRAQGTTQYDDGSQDPEFDSDMAARRRAFQNKPAWGAGDGDVELDDA